MVSREFLTELEPLLPGYIASRRWFRAKTKTISRVAIQDIVHATSADFLLLVLGVEFEKGDFDAYLLPVSIGTSAKDAEFIGEAGGKKFYSALSDEKFRLGLLDAIANNATLKGQQGSLVASRTSAFAELFDEAPVKLDSFVSRAEQSNTSIVFGDRFILKLFRKIEAGINPDIEVGRFLTEHNFANTPAVLGTLSYQTDDGSLDYAAGILQQFVKNRGDAWRFTLDSLGEFFERALLQPAPGGGENLPHSEELLGPYYDAARLLGKRTAEMHIALADPTAGEDFAAQPYTPVDAEALQEEMLAQAKTTFDMLRRKVNGLSGPTIEQARELLVREPEITGRFRALKDTVSPSVVRIRLHGDYHLGQILYTGDDFMIIDFEGEPAKPLFERRAKGLALRDVAGMLRSFQYAAYAALFGQISGVPTSLEARPQVEAWAGIWNSWISATYLQGYFSTARSHPFLPATPEQNKIFLDAFLLQKALYEIAYELNNRPDWVQIPLRGVLTLL